MKQKFEDFLSSLISLGSFADVKLIEKGMSELVLVRGDSYGFDSLH